MCVIIFSTLFSIKMLKVLRKKYFHLNFANSLKKHLKYL